MSRFETYADLPGQATIQSRPAPLYPILASLAGAAWPPLILTLPFWPPNAIGMGRDIDWRILVLLIGLAAVPAGLWRINQ
ncbi:MAG: phthalate transporter, partial [Pseudomonadota bacterium]|nr:phthalate transporter [Pseudomonadota bacterium]